MRFFLPVVGVESPLPYFGVKTIGDNGTAPLKVPAPQLPGGKYEPQLRGLRSINGEYIAVFPSRSII